MKLKTITLAAALGLASSPSFAAADGAGYLCRFPGYPPMKVLFSYVGDMESWIQIGSAKPIAFVDVASVGTGMPGHIYKADYEGGEYVFVLGLPPKGQGASLQVTSSGGRGPRVKGRCPQVR